MDKKIIVRAVLAAWIIIWVIFLIRPYFKKDLMRDYSILLKLPTEGKRAYIAGAKLYELIKFSNQFMPKASSYEIIGLEENSLEHRRVRYYLYPNVEKEKPEFLVVYGTRNFVREGYKIFKILDLGRYILRKVI